MSKNETSITMQARIIHPYLKAEEWAKINPILQKGEIGFESDTGLNKQGDGETHWNDLSYLYKDGSNIAKTFKYSYALAPKALSEVYKTKGYHDMHRGMLFLGVTGTKQQETERAFMYLERTVNGETTCELVPISYFSKNTPLDEGG